MKFWQRLYTGWAAAAGTWTATWAFVTTFSVANSGYDRALRTLIDANTFLSYGLVVVVISLFVVAYPVERWLIKDDTRKWANAATYVGVFVGLGLLLWIINFAALASVVLFVLGIIGAVIAAIGRTIYPFLVLHRTLAKVTATTTFVITVLSLAGVYLRLNGYLMGY